MDAATLKRIRQTLNESEELFRLAFHASPDAMNLNLLENGAYIDINEGFTRLTGYAREEVLGKTSLEIGIWRNPEDRGRLVEGLRQAGFIENFEAEFRRKNGAIGVGLMSARVLTLAGHAVILSITRDITERKLTERLLAEAEGKYRALFDISSLAILIRNRQGIITLANPAAARLFGAKRPEDLVGIPYLDLVHPEDRELSRLRIEGAFRIAADPAAAGEELLCHLAPRRHRLLTLSGRTVPVESTGVAFRHGGEDFIQGLFRDITDELQAEEALRDSEARFRTAFENASVGITLVDLDGTYLEVNRTMAAMIGYEPQELVGKKVVDFIFPGDLGRREEFVRALAEERLAAGEQERRFLHRDGTIVWVHIWATLQRDGRGRPQYFISLVQDITARKKAAEEKSRLESQLLQAQKMEAIGVLAGGIAHDFNNILSAIIGFTELATLNEGQAGDYLREVLKAAKRAKDLVSQILSFSRQGGEERLPVHVGRAAKEVVNFLRASIPSTIEIRLRGEHTAATVLASAVELHQILMNLCTNAMQAIGENAGWIDIEVEPVALKPAGPAGPPELDPGAYVRIAVRDSGHGIPAAIRERIFDPYFTTKEKGVGTGLGLAVVHGIVKKLHGAVSVNSGPGQGALFEIWLPQVDFTRPQEEAPPASLLGGTGRILFVDDEAMLAELGEKILRRLGYEVVTRTSPLEALELFKRRPMDFDLVISDQTMPGMTGDLLAQEILNIRPGMPIILCTGYSQRIDERRAREKGISALVMKPILIQDIDAAVRRALSP